MHPSKLKELYQQYQQVYAQEYDHIKGQKVGVLYAVIYRILDSDKTQADQICQDLGIEGNSKLKDDLYMLGNLIKNNLLNSSKNTSQSPSGEQMINEDLYFIIIIIALGILLVYLFLKNRENTQLPLKSPIAPTPATPPKKSESASLCLVVPASVARKFTNNNPINQADIKDLIGNASYFLCTNDQKADSVQENLDLTDEKITDISEQREVYIRINIADGQDMIGKQISYTLKSNLPAHGQGVIRKIACIKYLSVLGLEEFNRI
ncbi:hypothetical protein NWP22_05665 [Anabaenopsis tanganyikae CS-531]|uniref:Uncharacterized protein n=2 Tax=Anabaenopsis TaxID=110103 RepID=A0ABT6KDC9_9CYAN|nr:MULTISPECIES: hypothetical protein [Anabaenopsis]MDB9541479.1 hypothetical protein [Anabaenopsis arnoldii]MDH6090458.1 hypothetical protein [Anabaenopsis arnoldii]MDH6105359.1 hypothetical protein [Anabaenopsis tanganyikae CS-531]